MITALGPMIKRSLNPISMKKNFLSLVLMIPLFGFGQDKKVDPVSVQILDHMNDLL